MDQYLKILVFQKGNLPQVSAEKVAALLNELGNNVMITETSANVISFKTLVLQMCQEILEKNSAEETAKFMVITSDAIIGNNSFDSMVASPIAYDFKQKFSKILLWATFGSAFSVPPKYVNIDFNFGNKIEPSADPDYILAQKIKEAWNEIFPN